MPTTPVYDQQSIVPPRDLRIQLDVDETVVVSPAQEFARHGTELGRASVAGNGSSAGVECKDGFWGLKPSSVFPDLLSEQAVGDAVSLRLANFNIANNFVESPIYKANDDLIGVTLGPNVHETGDWFIHKKVVGGQSAANILSGSTGRIPQPIFPSQNVNVDRVAESKITFRANTGFHLRFIVPNVPTIELDNLMVFYFGGNPGFFAVIVYGNGEADLQSLVASPGLALYWQQLLRFRYAPVGQVQGKTHSITFNPKGNDSIGIVVGSSSAGLTHGRGPDEGAAFGSPTTDPHANRYKVNIFTQGQGATVTGLGTVLVDVRRDLLLWWQISVQAYPITDVVKGYAGVLIDHPCVGTWSPPSGWSILVQLKTIDAPNCAITPKIYLADDVNTTTGFGTSPLSGAQVSPGLWNFTAPGGRRDFYVAYFFTSDGFATAYLDTAVVFYPPRLVNRTGLKQMVTPNEVSITGADGDPERETASFVWEDQGGQGVLLRQRARIHSKIQAAYIEGHESKANYGDATVLISNLFDGEVTHCEAELKGVSDAGWPSEFWRRFEAQMAGLWARAHDQFNFYRLTFNAAPQKDPTTGRDIAPRVSAMIYLVLRYVMGVPDAELDIPDVDIRLMPSMPSLDDYSMAPHVYPLDWIKRLCDQFLGYTIVRDHNAGVLGADQSAVGMWRLRPRTSPDGVYTPLWNFVFQPAANVFGPPHQPVSYPANTSFISREGYFDWVEAPEANCVIVIAADASTKLPNQAGQFKTFAVALNPLSFNFDPDHPTATDPTHPDFLGRFVPLVVIDFTLSSVAPEDGGPEGACRALAFALLDQIGHGRKWARMRVPMPLVKDAADTLLIRRRPLRFDDPITINTHHAIVKSCIPEPPMQVSRQWAWVQAVFQNVDGGYFPM